MVEKLRKICSGTGNDQYSLMEYELAGFVRTKMVFIVGPACNPSRFNVGGFLWQRKIE